MEPVMMDEERQEDVSSDDTFTIEELLPADVDVVRTIFVENMNEQKGGTPEEAHAGFDEYVAGCLKGDMADPYNSYMHAERSTFLVAKQDGVVAGYVGCPPCKIGDPDFYA
eukprot:EC719851.1.p2 GENE.EC719851.1~~EC719851.1.p2  ORF type:complete len:111 (+),score=17.89 EC719851.1:33-365(+)